MNQNVTKLSVTLFLLRITVALVMAVWALDKIMNPGHAGAVFSNFYGIELGSAGLKAIGALQLAIIFAFLVGFLKTVSYGVILLMHAGSTLSSWQQYLAPFDNLLFFGAWPMLAACVGLFLLRRDDVLLSFPQRNSASFSSRSNV
ncbi:hypothetical protein [Hyphococcus sp.]|uniref:hypothetical protein n=1 Tax=Hyphococcus sp. TaxID=2038636 RepID=UPI002087D64E|nr:MAG: hypothetical protein DHS20C04_12970 [Marinicaulis sp.]